MYKSESSVIFSGQLHIPAKFHHHCVEQAWATEGGIRCPGIIRYPGIAESTKANNGINHAFTTVMDILPTIVGHDV